MYSVPPWWRTQALIVGDPPLAAYAPPAAAITTATSASTIDGEIRCFPTGESYSIRSRQTNTHGDAAEFPRCVPRPPGNS
jgi:hypothetical protein